MNLLNSDLILFGCFYSFLIIGFKQTLTRYKPLVLN
jgi:hypothetical protein